MVDKVSLELGGNAPFVVVAGAVMKVDRFQRVRLKWGKLCSGEKI